MTEVETLRSLVTTLAGEPEVQLSYVDALGVAPDELALELHDLVLRLPVLVRERKVTAAQAEAVLVIARKFSEMSGREHRERWTRVAVEESEDWEEVRAFAAAALRFF